MKRIIFHLISYIFLFSFVLAQNKLKFSAETVESSRKNDVTMNLFKKNVEVEDGDRVLYADLAMQIPDSNKVILSGNVKMYEKTDSLQCDELTIIKNQQDIYYATGNVILKDSLRIVLGDSLSIEYKNNLIDKLHIISNAHLYNHHYLKINNNNQVQFFEDQMNASHILVDFNSKEQIDFILLSGMASTNFNVIRQNIIKGINEVSGDSILIKFNNDAIDAMEVNGGVIGKFIPDQQNQDIMNPILYQANQIHYNLNTEKTLLIDNAEVIYGMTTLKGGEIEADLNLNLIESKIKDSILPSVSSDGESPTYGEYMIFDLKTERGNITEGYNKMDMGIFKGDDFLTDKNEDVYIQNAIFTSCDLETPHYHFGSNKMKIINSKEQIVSRPMVLYIQDFPAINLPLTILPNSNRKSKSGFIMPSFGHSSTLGTWIQDLGYYYAPNDYYDILTYIDFYDKDSFRMKSIINYKRLYGKKWYNYQIEGHLKIKDYMRQLNVSDDFINLGDKAFSSEDYSIHFQHYQDFDPRQYIRINYNYHSYYNINDINMIENNHNAALLQQTEDSKLFYSKSSLYGSLSIGASADRNLNVPSPSDSTDENTYKHESYPGLDYRYRNSSLFGKGDQWYHNTSLSYSAAFLNQYKSYTKHANSDGTDWIEEDQITIISPGATHTLKFSFPVNLSLFNITPTLNFYEKWSINNDLTEIQARSSDYDLKLNIETILFGLFNFNIGKLSAIHHTMTPSMNFSYNPKSQITKGHIDDFSNHRVNISNNSSSSINLSLRNLFQAKILDSEGEYIKRSILGLNFNTSYDFENDKFGDLFSKISFKNKQGGEYLRINMQHTIRNIFEGRSLELKSLTTSISRRFGHKLIGEQSSDSMNSSTIENANKSVSSYGNSKNSIWDAEFNINVTAKYDLENKWDITYTNLDITSNIYLSKKWKMKNKIYLDLVDMNIEYYKFEFKRSLHCWEFEFFMVPIGYNKGFGLRINISDPGLQSLRVTQSTVRGWS